MHPRQPTAAEADAFGSEVSKLSVFGSRVEAALLQLGRHLRLLRHGIFHPAKTTHNTPPSQKNWTDKLTKHVYIAALSHTHTHTHTTSSSSTNHTAHPTEPA